jgi:hypothetical protein
VLTAPPYYPLVPKDTIKENLEWRARMLQAAIYDVDMQHMLRQAAFEDLLFFINAFCWLREPRGWMTTIPFVTWPSQDPFFLAMEKQIEDSRITQRPTPLTVRKSRGQGGTWGYICFDLWHWLKDTGYSVGYVTRNEDLVDSRTDEDTILWKAAWEIQQLPEWMLPKGYVEKDCRSLSEHTILNPERMNHFAGYSASQDAGRGGRKTVFRCDEIGSEDFISGDKDQKVMASVSHVTYCMCLVSTYGGDHGVFYEAAEDPENDRKVTLDWRDNPIHAAQAYVMRDGKPAAVKPGEQAAVEDYVREHAAELRKLERRGHKMEGHTRSPWYDACCLLPGATPRSVARELDLNPRGAVGKVFDVDVLDRVQRECCRLPIWEGKPVFDSETSELKGLIRQEKGPLKLWFKPGVDNSAPRGRYAIGCDISAGGTGDYSSNSVACGVNMQTGEQVLEWAAKGWMATKFARLAVCLSKWLYDAFLGWEASGPVGVQFDNTVEECRYYNVYERDAQEIGSGRKLRKRGWYNGSDADKGRLFEELCIAFEEGAFIPRSEDLVRECGEYEWVGGKIIHRPSKSAGELEKAHGDRCIGGGVAYLLCRDRPETRLDKAAGNIENPEYGSFGWRQLAEERERMRWSDDVPQATIEDVLRST